MSASKATCSELVFKTVQIYRWETPVTKSSRKVIKIENCSRFVINNQLGIFHLKKISGRFDCKFLCCFLFSGFFLYTVNSTYFSNLCCCILDYFILNCRLWDKFLSSMIILILIISYILVFYTNFKLFF